MTVAQSALARLTRTTRTRGARTVARREARTAYLFLTPALIFFAVLFFYPLGKELYTSLYAGPRAGRFVGLGNYSKAIQDPAAQHSFLITLVFAAGVVVASITLGLLLAVILDRPFRGKTILRGLLIVPYLTSIVVVGLLWRNILDPRIGILNDLLRTLGLPTQSWLVTQPLAVLIMVMVWQITGYTMVLFLAGLQGIPEEYHEAARVDGASPRQRFWRITLPLLAPTTLFVSIIGVITALKEFALPYLITRGGPGNATELYGFHVFNVAFRYRDFGYASALAFLLLLVILGITLVQLRYGHREVEH